MSAGTSLQQMSRQAILSSLAALLRLWPHAYTLKMAYFGAAIDHTESLHAVGAEECCGAALSACKP